MNLPHADYIEAVTDALTAAGLKPAETDVRDSEACGATPFLDAVITLTPEDSGIPANRFEHGLILIWEHHTGHEDGYCQNDGAGWQWARLCEDGSTQVPEPLPVYGYASPAAVVEAVRKVISREIKPALAGWDGGVVGDSWERADEVDAACEAWATGEAA